MKNNVLITDLGPHLMADYSIRRPIRHWSTRLMGSAFWMLICAILFWLCAGLLQAQSNQPDPLVVKVYPDGTRVILPWSEMGKQMDMGEKFGGPPKIIPYNPAKDGIVPIGQASSKSAVGGENGNLGAGAQKNLSSSAGASGDPLPLQGPQEGFYIGLQPGGSVVQDINFERVSASGTINGTPVTGSLDATLVLDAGFRFDLPIGYRVNEWFSIEFAPGITFNPMNSVQLNSSLTIGSDTFVGGGTPNLSGNLIQVPLLVNFILTIPTDSSWEPFIGGGIGGIYSSAYFDTISNPNLSLSLDQEADCWSLGYSALAGLNYHVGNDISVGFVYKFTGTENQTFGGSTLGSLLNSTGTFTHSVSATATFRF